MKYDPRIHHRRSVRPRGYDYASPGAYFVTICAKERQCLFGVVADGRVQLSQYGQVVQAEWERTGILRPNVELDAHVVMPNHFHGIILLLDATSPPPGVVGARSTVPLRPGVQAAGSFGKPISGSLATIIGSFKAVVTKRINDIRVTPGVPVWQRNYYEHVLRDDESLGRARQYIANNALTWELDSFHVENAPVG